MLKGIPSGYDKMAAVIIIKSKKMNLNHDSVANGLIQQAEKGTIGVRELKNYGVIGSDAQELMNLHGNPATFSDQDATVYLKQDLAGWLTYLRQKNEWAEYRNNVMTMTRPPAPRQLELKKPGDRSFTP